MRRRHWLATIALVVAGCAPAAKAKRTKKTGGDGGLARMKRGPQGFGNVLVPSYIEDLKNGSADKQITAARALGNMGSGAKDALPVLEKLVSDKNAKVSAAAKSAVTAIKKR